MPRLKDKIAIVCGAGSIAEGWSNGKATAVLFAREGAKVFAVDRDIKAAEETRDIITAEGGECTAYKCDASIAAQVDAKSQFVNATELIIDGGQTASVTGKVWE